MGVSEYPAGHLLRLQQRLDAVDDIIELMIRRAQAGGMALRMMSWVTARIRTRSLQKRRYLQHAAWRQTPPALS